MSGRIVRAYLRVKRGSTQETKKQPLPGGLGPDNAKNAFQLTWPTPQNPHPEFLDLHDGSSSHELSYFDTVVPPGGSQEDLYKAMAPGLLQAVTEGGTTVLVAYGPSGSGKTLSIQGDAKNGPGIIPRLMKDLDESRVRAEKLRIAYIEDSKTYLTNLLDKSRPRVALGAFKMEQSDLEDKKIVMSVQNFKSAASIWKQATANRKIAKTDLNLKSSRSHAFMWLKGRINGSEFNFVVFDLAGMEQPGVSKDMNESRFICKSLSMIKPFMIAAANAKPCESSTGCMVTKFLKTYFEYMPKQFILITSYEFGRSREDRLAIKGAFEFARDCKAVKFEPLEPKPRNPGAIQKELKISERMQTSSNPEPYVLQNEEKIDPLHEENNEGEIQAEFERIAQEVDTELQKIADMIQKFQNINQEYDGFAEMN